MAKKKELPIDPEEQPEDFEFEDELKLINLRVRRPTEYADTVVPVLLTGNAKTSLAPQLQPLVGVDFREAEFYFRKLFDMI